MKLRIVKRNNAYMPQAKFLFWWYDLYLKFSNFRTLDDAKSAMYSHRDVSLKYTDEVVLEVTLSKNKITEDYK